MAVNFEPAKAGVATPALKPDRREAGARQDRWMLELEKAFASGTDRQDSAAGHAARPARADAARPFAPATAARFMPVGASAQADAAPAHAMPHRHGSAQAPAQAAARKAGSEQAPSEQAPSEQAASEQAAGEQAAGEQAAGADGAHHDHSSSQARTGGETDVQDGAAPPAVRRDDTVAAAPAPGVVAALQLAASYASPIGPALVAVATAEGAQSAALASVGRSPVGLAFAAAMGSGQPLPATAAFAAVERPEAAGGAAQKNADGKPFDKRAMHVYVDSEGVHAFIRDAALQAGQLRGVAQALSAEIAASGKTLAALTVNGKALDPRGASSRSEDDDTFTQHEERGEHAASLNYSTQPAFKGHP